MGCIPLNSQNLRCPHRQNCGALRYGQCQNLHTPHQVLQATNTANPSYPTNNFSTPNYYDSSSYSRRLQRERERREQERERRQRQQEQARQRRQEQRHERERERQQARERREQERREREQERQLRSYSQNNSRTIYSSAPKWDALALPSLYSNPYGQAVQYRESCVVRALPNHQRRIDYEERFMCRRGGSVMGGYSRRFFIG